MAGDRFSGMMGMLDELAIYWKKLQYALSPLSPLRIDLVIILFSRSIGVEA